MGIFGNNKESDSSSSASASTSNSTSGSTSSYSPPVNSKYASTTSTEAGRQVNMVGGGARIDGTLNVTGDVRIGGVIVGEVNVEKKCIVTSDGRVDANIRSGDAEIAGRVKGDIVTKGTLVMRSTCVVEGDIKCTRLMIEEGAIFKGRCVMRSPLTESGKSEGGAELKAVK